MNFKKPQKMPNVLKVENQDPMVIEITPKQLLLKIKKRDLEILPYSPKQKISNPRELADYEHYKRKEFEDNIRKNRMVVSNWTQYAQWEEKQKHISRARAIYECALDVDHRNITLWLKYVEMEMRNCQVNHARNLWDRAVTILPQVNEFWYKYTYMEEILENIAGARQVFERWMELEPEDQVWQSYINFEVRYKEIDRARDLYERFVIVRPDVKNWIKYARFEAAHGYIKESRRVYERAIMFYDDDSIDVKLYIAFTKFEEAQREYERARVIYKYALDHVPKERTNEIHKAYAIHQKIYGEKSGIEDVIVKKRKYEQQVKDNPYNYETWFDYLNLLENEGNHDKTRDVYERAIAYVPRKNEKQNWRQYIYLWINYAIFEELETRDIKRCRRIYKVCLSLIPNETFTFAKVWIYYAEFEIRQKNLSLARYALGRSLGICPKNKLFQEYKLLENKLQESGCCQKLDRELLKCNRRSGASK